MSSYFAEIRSRLGKGVAAQGIVQAFGTLIRILEIPLFLHFWGVQLFGEWLIIAAIPTYLAMSDAGFASAAYREMAMLVAAGERREAKSVFQSATLVIVLLSVVLLLVSIAVVNVLPLRAWFNLQYIGREQFIASIIILVVYVITTLQSNLLYGGFFCVGRYGLGDLFLGITRFIEFTMMSIAIACGSGVIGAAVCLAVGRIAGTIAMRITLRRVTPWLSYGLQQADWALIKKLVNPAIAGTAFPIGDSLNIQSMRLIVAATIGPIAVATFTTLRTLSRVPIQFLYSMSKILIPEMSIARGREDSLMVRRLYLRACQVSIWGTAALCIVLWLFGKGILGVWTRWEIMMDQSVFGLLLLVAIINSFWFSALMIAFAINKHARMASVYMVGNLITLGLAFILSSTVGLIGVCVSLLSIEIMMSLYVIPRTRQLAGVTRKEWLSTVSRPPIHLLRDLGTELSVLFRRTICPH